MIEQWQEEDAKASYAEAIAEIGRRVKAGEEPMPTTGYFESMTHDPGGKVRLPLQSGVRGAAEFSPCGRYRYWLSRWWEPTGRAALWIGMNPSTAEADVDDPTIRKEMHFTRALGLAGYIKCNVMDYRATKPKDLLTLEGVNAASPQNLQTIISQARHASMVFAAWGALLRPLRRYADEVAFELRPIVGDLWCMGVTADGSPRHPLYLRNDAQPMPWISARRWPSVGPL